MASRRSPLRAFVGRYAIAFGAAAIFMGGAIFTVNYVIDEKLDAVDRVDVTVAEAPPEGANYLLIGSDTREFVGNEAEEEAFGTTADAGGQRSDTMMVLHVEPDAQRTLAVSFPRDLWVEIPGVGGSKINAAFNEGGPDTIVKTLKDNFGIEINHYLEVDFRTFKGVVNAIGNVPVYFPYAAKDEKTGLYVTLPGCPRLDGAAALSYVRSRGLEYYSIPEQEWVNADAVPDIDRIARQQDFMRKLAGLAVQKSLNDPLAANEIADEVLGNLRIDENLSKSDIFALIDAFRTINPNDQSSLEFQTFPWEEGPSQEGQSVLYPNEPDASAMIARLMDFSGNRASSGRRIPPAEITVKVVNGSGRDGEATAALTELKALGFKGAGTGNDERGTIDETEIHYKAGAQDKAKAVFRYLTPDARLVEDPDLKGADVAIVLGANFAAIERPSDQTSSTTASTTAVTTPASPTTPASDAGTPAPISNEDRLGEPARKTPPC
jgi:LCP family protein required for cell wall assembly